MDDDIFFDDSELDPREQELRLAENEMKKRDKEHWNQGYLTGLEWAVANYLSIELSQDNLAIFQAGIEQGLQKAGDASTSLFSEAGALK